jgi:hypothetical protein
LKDRKKRETFERKTTTTAKAISLNAKQYNAFHVSERSQLIQHRGATLTSSGRRRRQRGGEQP